METKKEFFKKVDFTKKLQNGLTTLVSQKLLCIAWYGNAVSNKKIKILWLYVKNKKEAAAVFSDHKNLWYMGVYAAVVIGFTFLYTALIFNPKQISDNLKQNNGFIPGVKPGKKTAEYIDSIMSRITLPGSILLALIAILPAFARLFGVSMGFAQFFGGTSLLIMVGVILDTLQQIESHLLMRHYDGFFESGMRIKGRSGAMAY